MSIGSAGAFTENFKIHLSDDFPLITFIEGTRLNGILVSPPCFFSERKATHNYNSLLEFLIESTLCFSSNGRNYEKTAKKILNN